MDDEEAVVLEPQRLQLIARICEAVDHAHQRGVIHRDLKPSNILVVEEEVLAPGRGESRLAHSSSPQPKILDFGVARASDRDVQTATLRTEVGQIIGTVRYMSPEQAAGDPDQIATRSEVYSIGVIAYELLAGRMPYQVHERLIHEAVRVIREDEPTPLSSVNRSLRGEIETIVAKALEKDKVQAVPTGVGAGDCLSVHFAPPRLARHDAAFRRPHSPLGLGRSRGQRRPSRPRELCLRRRLHARLDSAGQRRVGRDHPRLGHPEWPMPVRSARRTAVFLRRSGLA